MGRSAPYPFTIDTHCGSIGSASAMTRSTLTDASVVRE